MDDKDVMEHEVFRIYGTKYGVEVISLSPAFVIWYVWLLQMVICLHHALAQFKE
jgi:hypothetical protein